MLRLAVHEFRSPVGVVAGYIGMVLKDRAGTLTDQQRGFLDLAAKSCGHLAALTAEMSELYNLDAGTAAFNRSHLDLYAVLADTVATLPARPDREVRITISAAEDAAPVDGDPVRLKMAFGAIFNALRRELVTSDELVVRARRRDRNGAAVAWIAMAEPARVEALATGDVPGLTVFDEWREGCGFSLPIARRVIEGHGGLVWSPATESKAGAVAMLPLAS